MNRSNKLPLTLTALGLAAATSFAEIKVSDYLNMSGFLDMSASGFTNDASDTLIATFDQFELDLLFKFGEMVTARADLAYGGVGGGSNTLAGTFGGVGAVALEQGFATATLGSFSVSSGRFLSTSGWEAAEPTGMYQFSYSKAITSVAGPVYGGYQNGLNLAYNTPKFGIYGAVVADVWNTAATDLMTPGFEGQLSLMPVEGVTAKATYLYQVMDEDVNGGDASQQLLNVWASYVKGPLTAAAEYNLLIDWTSPTANDDMGNGWLVMGNYKFTDRIATTLRYSGMILGDLDPDTEVTLSPSFSVSPNWLALAELRYDIDLESTSYAVETTLFW